LSKRFIAMLAGVVALVVVAAGCGSSSGSSSLTKAEFIKQGDAVCQKADKRIADEANEFAKENGIDTSKPSSKDKEEAIEKVVAPGLKSEAEELSGLGIPREDGDKAEAVLTALESGVGKLAAEPAALLEAGGSPLDKASELAREFGFKVCGQQ
jgi:hypothetical protein